MEKIKELIIIGYFDILEYKIKCLKCGKKREWELQIKTFVKDGRRYDSYPFTHKIGDEVIVNDDVISGHGNCPNCMTSGDFIIKVIEGKISDSYTHNADN